jgi:uncharacterized Zn-finger protein
VFTIALFPAARTLLKFWEIHIDALYLFTSLVLLTGWLCSILDMPIYMFFEGRNWPGIFAKLRRALIKRETKRMENLKSCALTSLDDNTALEAATELRKSFYSVGNGTFDVRYPTRLGNLISAYERYSERVYGYDATFLWYRIWVKINKDLREELDNTQAMADSSIYLVTALAVISLVYLPYFVISLIDRSFYNPGDSAWIYLIASIISGLASFLLYRISLHVHDSFGRLFTAVVDDYVGEVTFPMVEKHVDRILTGKPIDMDQEHTRSGLIMDYMQGNRIDSPIIKGERLWISDWNNHLTTIPSTGSITLKHSMTPEMTQVAVVSCSGQSVEIEHPTIYLKLRAGEVTKCPYCNLKFSI